MGRRYCKCISCIEERKIDDQSEESKLSYVPLEDRDKELCFIIHKDHMKKFKGYQAHILVVSENNKNSDFWKYRVGDSYESYGSIGKWETYKYNGKYYDMQYGDPELDREIKDVVAYNVAIFIPQLNYTYIFFSVIGEGGVRKIKHNVRKMTSKRPFLINKRSKNQSKKFNFFDQMDKERNKLLMTNEYMESWW